MNKQSGQVPDNFTSDNHNILQLVNVIGNDELSVKEMMRLVDLRHRETFLNNYLTPAVKEGFIRLLYPASPRHPRQK